MLRKLWVYAIGMCLAFPAVLPGQLEIPGLQYEFRKAEGPLSIHLLQVDPRKIRIQPERALNNGIGRETVSSMSARNGAVAALNAGFFRIGGRYDGEPTGILKIGDSWFSDPSLPRGAIGWNQSGMDVLIDRIFMQWSVNLGGRTLPVDGINRPRGVGERVLYGWPFHRTTLTNPGGLEILFNNNRIVGLNEKGDSPIPPDGFVYSVGPRAKDGLPGVALEDPVRISHELLPVGGMGMPSPEDWQTMDYIVGGVPVLIRKGEIVEDFSAERAREGFIKDRHPRTAVGVRADGIWIIVVVDGRQPNLSIGMTIAELAKLLNSLGCLEALNLDGGGSSTLVLNGKVVNSPSDLSERSISDAILLFAK